MNNESLYPHLTSHSGQHTCQPHLPALNWPRSVSATVTSDAITSGATRSDSVQVRRRLRPQLHLHKHPSLGQLFLVQAIRAEPMPGTSIIIILAIIIIVNSTTCLLASLSEVGHLSGVSVHPVTHTRLYSTICLLCRLFVVLACLGGSIMRTAHVADWHFSARFSRLPSGQCLVG